MSDGARQRLERVASKPRIPPSGKLQGAIYANCQVLIKLMHVGATIQDGASSNCWLAARGRRKP